MPKIVSVGDSLGLDTVKAKLKYLQENCRRKKKIMSFCVITYFRLWDWFCECEFLWVWFCESMILCDSLFSFVSLILWENDIVWFLIFVCEFNFVWFLIFVCELDSVNVNFCEFDFVWVWFYVCFRQIAWKFLETFGNYFQVLMCLQYLINVFL